MGRIKRLDSFSPHLGRLLMTCMYKKGGPSLLEYVNI